MTVTKELIRKWSLFGMLDRNRATKATSKKHKHIAGKQFKSIMHTLLTPAEYRNRHAKMVNGKIRYPEKKRKTK